MNRILDWLYVGPYRDAENAELLKEAGVQAVLSLAYPVEHPDILVAFVPFDDGASIPEEALHGALRFVRRQKRAGRKVLIACSGGISRSPSIAIAVLHEVEGYPLVEAFRTVLTRVPSAFPDPAVWNSLCRFYRQMVGVNDVWPQAQSSLRTYGASPFTVAVVHGGPGAAGEMAPVARKLASRWGILEPLQTATSLEEQVEELAAALENRADLPVTLIGFSWGAWLSFIVAARHPALIKKLILVSSGPFEEKYVVRLHETRLSRLDAEERAELEHAIEALGDPATEGKDAHLVRLGALVAKTDAYDPIAAEPPEPHLVGGQGDIYHGVWQEAAAMRRSGELLQLGERIQCPVFAIHGDHDPHPAEGVREPLSRVVTSFRFILLENCGHTPWIERQARAAFYRVLGIAISA